LLRPTWHFVLPADIRWLIEPTGPRVQAQNAYWYRKFGLDDEPFRPSNELLAAALAGNALTRAEIATQLARRGIVADGLRLGYILMRAELDLVVCSGAPKGKSQTYGSKPAGHDWRRARAGPSGPPSGRARERPRSRCSPIAATRRRPVVERS